MRGVGGGEIMMGESMDRLPWKVLADHQRITRLKLDELKARLAVDSPGLVQTKLTGGVLTEFVDSKFLGYDRFSCIPRRRVKVFK
jgi:hypothetical protein